MAFIYFPVIEVDDGSRTDYKCTRQKSRRMTLSCKYIISCEGEGYFLLNFVWSLSQHGNKRTGIIIYNDTVFVRLHSPFKRQNN
jgi:hypothetical protein